MANVINLGNLGNPSSPETSGLGAALAAGTNAGVNVGKAILDYDIAKKEAAIRSASIGMQGIQAAAQAGANLLNNKETLDDKRTSLQLQLAKLDQEKEKSDREHATTLLADLSSKYNTMKPEIREMFKTHDIFKNAQKFISKHLPERIDDGGNLILMDDKDVIATTLEKIRANNAQILANGGELTEGQQKAQDLLDKIPDKEVQIVLDQASKDFLWQDPEQRGKIINSYMTQYIAAKNALSRSKNLSSKPSERVDPSDPLGVFTNSSNPLSSALGGQ